MPQAPPRFAPIDYKTRFPALDGIRALAVTLVFFEHYGGGSHGSHLLNLVNQIRLHFWVGVDLFFVLSGFLITGILYDTRADSHYFKRFFLRRAVRIFPVFYVVVLLVLVLTPFLHYQLRPGHLWFLAYLGNLFANHEPTLYAIVSTNHPAFNVNIAHFWSLCVEEQFYLFWPLVVWFLRDRVKIIRFAVAMMVLAFATRMLFCWLAGADAASGWSLRSLPFRLDALVVGAILALVLRGPNADRWQRLCRPVFLVSTVAVLVLFVLRPLSSSLWLMTVGLPLVALASAGLIGMTLRPGAPAFQLFYVRPLRILGKYSYGFYVYHALFVHAWIEVLLFFIARLHSMMAAGLLALGINFAVTFLVSKYSYDLFEVRFLRLKRNFEYDSEQAEHKHAFTTK